MQDKVILGLLAYGEASLYDLKKIMEQSTSMFYNTSIGSIHPALKKLESAGFVTSTDVAHGKRIKKIYQRTAAGAEAFQQWINTPTALFKTKDESMLRLYYYGHIDGDIGEHLRLYIAEADQWIESLQTIIDAQDLEKIPAEWKKIAFFQIATARYGLDTIKFSKRWYEELLTEYQRLFPEDS